jgi:hypothetical protein
MNATVEQSLISKIETLSPQQVAEVEDFVEFLAAKSQRRAALDRLLSIAPALEAAGVAPMGEEVIAAEVKAARAERRARLAAEAAKDAGADPSSHQRGDVCAADDRTHLRPIGTHRCIAVVTAREVVEQLAATVNS